MCSLLKAYTINTHKKYLKNTINNTRITLTTYLNTGILDNL